MLRKNITTVVISVLLFCVVTYASNCAISKVCGVTFLDRLVRSKVTLLMPKGAIDAEVATTKASRELGLSGRSKMSDTQGLLFVFEEPGKYGFWMKDMAFPLDIIWINDDGVVVSIERELTPESYPHTFINQASAKYVLEINAGLAEKFGLYLGSKVKMTD